MVASTQFFSLYGHNPLSQSTFASLSGHNPYQTVIILYLIVFHDGSTSNIYDCVQILTCRVYCIVSSPRGQEYSSRTASTEINMRECCSRTGTDRYTREEEGKTGENTGRATRKKVRPGWYLRSSLCWLFYPSNPAEVFPVA